MKKDLTSTMQVGKTPVNDCTILGWYDRVNGSDTPKVYKWKLGFVDRDGNEQWGYFDENGNGFFEQKVLLYPNHFLFFRDEKHWEEVVNYIQWSRKNRPASEITKLRCDNCGQYFREIDIEDYFQDNLGEYGEITLPPEKIVVDCYCGNHLEWSVNPKVEYNLIKGGDTREPLEAFFGDLESLDPIDDRIEYLIDRLDDYNRGKIESTMKEIGNCYSWSDPKMRNDFISDLRDGVGYWK